ncbi:hypothetical protein QR680_001006 [Steinernema hermaphroditum]|uniref:Uncharacterized protein n=1 Tax=Steinernema hermaphroditum TaxID=289476 RepID=A0AA39GYM2_9BILA|nr:hypothetical protein QR680_001006 [Steinernema hermaphroditum]
MQPNSDSGPTPVALLWLRDMDYDWFDDATMEQVFRISETLDWKDAEGRYRPRFQCDLNMDTIWEESEWSY